MNEHDMDSYIGFVIHCRISTNDVRKAFALATTFNMDERICILEMLKQIRGE